jgi:CoA:oxalate CoA-transferase
VANRAALVALLDAAFATRTADAWVAALTAAGVPAGKLRGVLEAFDAAAAAGDPATVTVEHPTAGPLALVRPPLSLAEAGLRAPEAPPLLGQHTREVLAELRDPG